MTVITSAGPRRSADDPGGHPRCDLFFFFLFSYFLREKKIVEKNKLEIKIYKEKSKSPYQGRHETVNKIET